MNSFGHTNGGDSAYVVYTYLNKESGLSEILFPTFNMAFGYYLKHVDTDIPVRTMYNCDSDRGNGKYIQHESIVRLMYYEMLGDFDVDKKLKDLALEIIERILMYLRDKRGYIDEDDIYNNETWLDVLNNNCDRYQDCYSISDDVSFNVFVYIDTLRLNVILERTKFMRKLHN